MSHQSLRARTATLLGLVALGVALCASTAGAASIYACVSKHSGSARFVGAKSKCKKSERRVSWNTTGPAGPRGPGGAAGASGAGGANGSGPDYASRAMGPTDLGEADTGVVRRLEGNSGRELSRQWENRGRRQRKKRRPGRRDL